jgi:glycine/D-amino acid oxidase-like deaminating enzyme
MRRVRSGAAGLTLGPCSAKSVAAQMLRKAPEMDLTPYSSGSRR